MFKNYLKVALRHLKKSPTYSFINLAGLAVGMACCLLISLYVINELGYDRFHHQADGIFRVKIELDLNGILYKEASIQFPAAEAFLRDFPEVKHAVRFYRDDNFPLMRFGDTKFTEEKFFFADPAVFEVFDFPLVKGDAATAFNEPNSVVLTEATAKKYFGEADPLGQVLRYQNSFDLKVTGVAKNVPQNSHFKFDFLAPMQFQLNLWEGPASIGGREKQWFWTGCWTYLLLSDGHAAQSLSAKLPAFVGKYFPERYQGGSLALQPLADIHLHSNLDNEIEPNSQILYVYIFSAIAFLILLIACINFVNLTTAKSATRAKEVGVRKVVGANKKQLIFQLLGETITASVIALAIALVIVELLLPAFNTMTGRPLSMSMLQNWQGLTVFLSLAFAVGILSGIYPAFFLSGFNPVSIFKGTIPLGSGSPATAGLRKALVVTQFAITCVLLIGISVVYQQLNFLRAKNLGFNKEQVMFIKAKPDVSRQLDAFRSELLQSQGIVGVSSASNIPGQGVFAYRFVPEGGSRDNPVMLPLMLVDYDFLQTMNIDVTQGRGLSREHPSDPAEAFLLNERAVQDFGWEDNPIGKKMELFAAGTTQIAKSGYVVGVIRDYHFESLHHEVKPLVLTYSGWNDYYAVKISGGNMNEALAQIESVWEKFSPAWPLEYVFLDRKLEQLYQNENKLAQIINAFALIAIVIACLGLFGLSTYAAEKRVKEIGIRKVLGASARSIVSLLTGDFIKLVLLANVVAWPAAYFAMNKWLHNFAYRVDVSWPVFATAGALTLLIAVLSVSAQAIKAALANPVESLRYE
jgi:putative ABC transport system permease protein